MFMKRLYSFNEQKTQKNVKTKIELISVQNLLIALTEIETMLNDTAL